MAEAGQNSNPGACFKDKTIEELLKASFKDPTKTKLKEDENPVKKPIAKRIEKPIKKPLQKPIEKLI